MDPIHQARPPRLGDCEVCGEIAAKYTCPECEVKTCSLPCVRIHKTELNCSGKRNKVKYKSMNKFTDLDLQNDYMLLEETARAIETYSKENNKTFWNKCLTPVLMKLKAGAGKRGVQLEFLPLKFTRRLENTTYLNWATDSLYWKVEWVFPFANNLRLCDKRVLDTDVIAKTLEKYMDSNICEDEYKEKLNIYHKQDPSEVVLLLKAEKFEGLKFFLVNRNASFREELKGKVIIEHPIFYVVSLNQVEDYQILVPDDDGISPENFFFGE